MNGRFYDPRLHRFLQPDNNLQEPYNTQNYNRYGYVLNNPLKYTDPTGEFTWSDLVAAAAIVAGVIVIIASNGAFTPVAQWLIGTGVAHFGATSVMQANNGGSWDNASNYIGLQSPTININTGLGDSNGGGKKDVANNNNIVESHPNVAITGNTSTAANNFLNSYNNNNKTTNKLTYNGTFIVWSDALGTVLDSFDATSGLPGSQWSDWQPAPSEGPIPEGKYRLDINTNIKTASYNRNNGDIYSGKGIQKIPSSYLTLDGKRGDYAGWGTMRVALVPLSGNMYGRSNFYIHDSHKGWTSGCIEVNSLFFPRLLNYASSHNSIILTVQYPIGNTTTRGNTKF